MTRCTWWVVGIVAVIGACEMHETSTGEPGGSGASNCGDCVSSEYCPTGYYCDTDPCRIDCSCSWWGCAGTCAGICTPYSGPYCGDGTCMAPETCDSCSKDCACVCGNGKCEKLEDCDSCADCACVACTTATDMTATNQATISITTERDSVDGSCASGDGAEQVIRFTEGWVGQRREVRVVSADFLVALSVRTACDDATTEVGCALQMASDDPAPVRFNLGPQQTAYIIVEAAGPPVFGSFTATVSVGYVP